MTTSPSVLLIEDDALVRLGIEQALTLADITARSFDNAEAALERLGAAFPGVIVTDVRLPGMDGLTLLERIVAIDRDIPVVLITGHGGISMAVQAMREGAYDFIEKPFASDRLVEVVKRGLDRRRLVLENRDLREKLVARQAARLVGEVPAVQQIRRVVSTIAPAEVDVLIYGETGCGKEVLARSIHAASGRKGEFVAINCGAMPESVFESEVFGHEAGAFTGAIKRRIGEVALAAGGTLFLDEIESMPLSLQVKLLRVLQERQVERLGSNQAIAVDCRVIAASKADLKALAEAGSFRNDLFYRLNVICIELPPLRERKADIPQLVTHFLIEAAERYRCPVPPLPDSRIDEWMSQDWPGNVRELRNAVDRFCLGVAATTERDPEDVSLSQRVDRFEREIIEQALHRAGGNVSAAAERLQLPRKTLYDKLQRHQLLPQDYRE